MFALGIVLCLLALLTTHWAGKKSLPAGLVVTLFWGYTYGILRANVLSPASHFIFDASLVGCYISCLFKKVSLSDQRRAGALGDWVTVITGWTLLIALLPFQTPFVTLVGLRGNLFFIPVLLLAARLRETQFRAVVSGLAALNLLALGFGLAEYFQGIERYYPYSPVTLIIYRSKDVAGGFYRIPAIFANAHAYAGTMVSTLPLLLGLLGLTHAPKWQRLLAAAGVVAALFGVLFANTRTNFVAAGLMIVMFILLGNMKPGLKALVCVGILGVALIALSNARFQRFRTLEDSDTVAGRIAGSVNRSFLEVIFEYPLGNGLGGGGTSVPHFLANQLNRPVSVENEYARIALELGVPGLLLWVGFLAWILTRGFSTIPSDPWRSTRRMVWVNLSIGYMLSLLGTGMLTAIPATFNMLLCAGWLATRPAPDDTTQVT